MGEAAGRSKPLSASLNPFSTTYIHCYNLHSPLPQRYFQINSSFPSSPHQANTLRRYNSSPDSEKAQPNPFSWQLIARESRSRTHARKIVRRSDDRAGQTSTNTEFILVYTTFLSVTPRILQRRPPVDSSENQQKNIIHPTVDLVDSVSVFVHFVLLQMTPEEPIGSRVN